MQLPQDGAQTPTPQNGVSTPPPNAPVTPQVAPLSQDNSVQSMIPLNPPQGASNGQNTGNGGQPAVNDQIDLIAAKSLAARLKKAESV